MFSKLNTVALPGAPSFQSNNLSGHGDLLCFVRLTEVSIVQDEKFNKIALSRSQISEASILVVGEEPCIVLPSNLGVQFWSLNGESMLFFHALEESGDYMRGVTSLTNCVCVGTSNGSIMVFRFNLSVGVSTGHLSTTTIEPLYNSSITALASSETTLCGGNEVGDIFVYNTEFDKDFRFVVKFPGTGAPCTSICCEKGTNNIFAGFATGHIRIYRPNICEISIEITGHARSITGMVISPHHDYFATCGEDQFFQVWKIPDFSNPDFADSLKKDCLLFCEKLENRLCTGIAFLSKNKIAVASYDDENLAIFQKN